MALKNVHEELQKKAIEILKEKLPSNLYYHNYEHTLDVIDAAERIAVAENTPSDQIELLKTASAFHDVGYVYARENHEQKSCAIATDLLLTKGVKKADIYTICDLILATKFPHHPKNKLGEIICDADLDYLGRDDYFSISKNLFKEFMNAGIVKDENDWNHLQVKFLETHHFFTNYSINSRKQKKDEHLRVIKERL